MNITVFDRSRFVGILHLREEEMHVPLSLYFYQADGFFSKIKQIQSLTLLPRSWLANTWHLPMHPRQIMIIDNGL